jgi:hypothetical protein
MKRTETNWILTYTGKQFWPTDPNPDDICIEDIAHSLANLCRYAGHCEDFYSVAEHSCLIAEKAPPSFRKWALLHDATEAYIVDLPRPVKTTDVIYRMVEEKLQKAVAQHFDLPWPIPEEVIELDNRILLNERAELFTPPHPVQPALEGLQPIENVHILTRSPMQARKWFLEMWEAVR